MLKFLADESFHGAVVAGLLRQRPALDLLTVHDVALAGIADRQVLEWAALEGRIVLTSDYNTFPFYAYERVQSGLSMPGVIEVKRGFPIALAIEEILLLAEGSQEGEWEGQVIYLPLPEPLKRFLVSKSE